MGGEIEASVVKLALMSLLGIGGAIIWIAWIKWRKEISGAIERFRAQGPVTKIAVVVFAILAIAIGGTKPEGDGEEDAPPPRMRSAPRMVVPIESDLTSLELPEDFPMVTNLCIWGIAKGEEEVELGLAWPQSMQFVDDMLDIYGNWQLLSNRWTRLMQVDVSGVQSNAIVRVDASDFPTNEMERIAFFRVADETDSDDDGLTDAEERWVYGTNPYNQDSDWDELLDELEIELGLDPLSADSDGDGMWDGWEILHDLNPLSSNDAQNDLDNDGLTNLEECQNGTNPWSRDTDNDGIDDQVEILAGKNPFDANSDYDNDGMPDKWESDNDLNPLDSSDANSDADNDGLSNLDEFRNKTDPHNCDTDGDGLSDSVEITSGTNPIEADSDNDGLNDGDEVNSYLTDPLVDDTDGDGLSDGEEVNITEYQFNPLEADFDNDGLRDDKEREYGTNPNDDDSDDDGLEDYEEIYYYGTDPNVCDTDGDGLNDGDEMSIYQTDPLNADTDGDLANDGAEVNSGRDPLYPEDPRSEVIDNYDTTGRYSVTVNYGEDDYTTPPEGSRIYGLTHSGTTTVDNIGYSLSYLYPESAFTMHAEGVDFVPRETGKYIFQVRADDSVNIVISNIEVSAVWQRGVGGLGEAVTNVLFEGVHYPMLVDAVNNGGPAELTLVDWGKFLPIERARLECGFSSKIIKADSGDVLVLTTIVNGGYFGADATFTKDGFGKLRLVGGDEMPNSLSLGSNESRRYTAYYLAEAPSLCTNDVNVVATLVERETEKLYAVTSSVTVVKAAIYGDYNRDGQLNGIDYNIMKGGRVLHHWLNDDSDSGDCAVDNSDIPGEGVANFSDAHVNGRCDLLDFVPIKLDLYDLLQLTQNYPGEYRYTLSATGVGVNAIWTGLDDGDARNFQIRDGSSYGENLNEPSYSAAITNLSSEVEIPAQMLNRMQTDRNLGIVMIEGTSAGEGRLVVKCIHNHGGLLAECSMPIKVSPISDMYRWIDLRSAYKGGDLSTSESSEPCNYPDNETDGKNFVFVHGYNVSAKAARGWASEIFKRLWQSGLQSKFVAVTWFGDDSQIHIPKIGDISPNYYINVEHAFMTAEALTNVCTQLQGDKVMLAHSLGNMLVSAAIKDFDLQYSKYYMLNAAVPMEAYNSTSQNSLMVDGAWQDLDTRFRASRWSEQFESVPYDRDFRKYLSWKNRFAGIANAINCYSSTEDVLENPSEIKVFGFTVGETTGGAWSKQELFKGCRIWHGVNVVSSPEACIEGGWGINGNYDTNPFAYIPLRGFNASYFSEYTRDDIITRPLFTSFNDNRMMSTNRLNIVNYKLRATMLGDAIPAESFAAGANEIGGVAGNYNYQSQTPNGWPRLDDDDNPVWKHSDLKNVAYFYVYELFKKLINETKQGE